ncbi:DUF2798 domain-containing protein [Cupriavidus pampae]|uniref:DUF2798 domain-containing protein n=1 Tax=Cupriavidus pampae TaxID=659251 RepID=UPI001CC5C0F7|nr:DUF2798 domain-containing protein [Cupriavidus pampae]
MALNGLRIPRRYGHLVFGVIQSGLTCAIAASIGSAPFLAQGSFLGHWVRAFGVGWLIMLPVVVAAGPVIHRIVGLVTAECDTGHSEADRHRLRQEDDPQIAGGREEEAQSKWKS